MKIILIFLLIVLLVAIFHLRTYSVGKISNCKFFNYVLTQEEINKLCNDPHAYIEEKLEDSQ